MPAIRQSTIGNRKSTAGFTIVELLVVITIIVLLLSMLMPAVTGAISAAQDAVCRTNLRQDGLAFINFATDHYGTLPGAYWTSWASTTVTDGYTFYGTEISP